MAAKGKAAKSASGASMSKYDVEVEKRLDTVEADVSSIALSVSNIERTLGELTKIDDLTETPEPPKPTEIQAVWDELHKQFPGRF